MSIDHARRRRAKRAAMLVAVAEGHMPLRKALLDGHVALGSCPTHKLLTAAPGLGHQGMRKVLERARVWPFTPVGELTNLQRRAIIENLPKRIQ